MLLVEFKLQIEAARSDMPLITELERQRQVDLSEFKVCLSQQVPGQPELGSETLSQKGMAG